MRNRHKILLRDHLVPEVYLKTCPKCYTVSAVSETHTTATQGPNRFHTLLAESTAVAEPPATRSEAAAAQGATSMDMLTGDEFLSMPPSGNSPSQHK